jgi:hypothetical protein
VTRPTAVHSVARAQGRRGAPLQLREPVILQVLGYHRFRLLQAAKVLRRHNVFVTKGRSAARTFGAQRIGGMFSIAVIEPESGGGSCDPWWEVGEGWRTYHPP